MAFRSSTQLSAILAACEAERVEAGCRRDGHGTVHVQTVIRILDAWAATCGDLSSSRYLRVAALRDKARKTKLLCEIHDSAERGELVGKAYGDALDRLRVILTDS